MRLVKSILVGLSVLIGGAVLLVGGWFGLIYWSEANPSFEMREVSAKANSDDTIGAHQPIKYELAKFGLKPSHEAEVFRRGAFDNWYSFGAVDMSPEEFRALLAKKGFAPKKWECGLDDSGGMALTSPVKPKWFRILDGCHSSSRNEASGEGIAYFAGESGNVLFVSGVSGH